VWLASNLTVPFDSGFVVSAITNGTVYAIGHQSEWKGDCRGRFMLDGRTENPHVARLNTDGSLDLSFKHQHNR